MLTCERLGALPFAIFVAVFLFAGLLRQNHAFANDIAPHNITIAAYAGLDPPRTYLTADGEAIGTSIARVREFLDATDITYSIHIVPWARALRTVNENSHSLIFNIGRTPEREENYYWILALSDFTDSLIARKDDEASALSQEEIIKGDYTAACERASLQCGLLKAYGFKPENVIEVSDLTAFGLLLMLERQRVDFIVANYRGLFFGEIDSPLPADHFTVVTDLNTTTAYLAAPKSIDPNIINALAQLSPSLQQHLFQEDESQ